MELKICAGISLSIFAFATWLGFVEPKDTSRWENGMKDWLNRKIFLRVKWNWAVDNPYALTKIGIVIGFALGLASIALA
jgi:hypothetical protein